MQRIKDLKFSSVQQQSPSKTTQILCCDSPASRVVALTQTCMDFSRLFVRNLRRITSGPTLKPWRLLGTEPCLLRSLSKSQDTLKYRSSVSAFTTSFGFAFNYMRVFFFFVYVNWSKFITKARCMRVLELGGIAKGRKRDGWTTMRLNELYWPAEDSPAFISSHYSERSSTTTQYYRTEIQHRHLQEVYLHFECMISACERVLVHSCSCVHYWKRFWHGCVCVFTCVHASAFTVV